MSKRIKPSLQIETLAKGLRNCIFFYRFRRNRIFSFQFPFWYTLEYLTYVLKFGWEDLVYEYLVTSEWESHSVQNMCFFVKLSFILSELGLSKREFPKLTARISKEPSDHTICPVLSVLFLYASAHRDWPFEKLS